MNELEQIAELGFTIDVSYYPSRKQDATGTWRLMMSRHDDNGATLQDSNWITLLNRALQIAKLIAA